MNTNLFGEAKIFGDNEDLAVGASHCEMEMETTEGPGGHNTAGFFDDVERLLLPRPDEVVEIAFIGRIGLNGATEIAFVDRLAGVFEEHPGVYREPLDAAGELVSSEWH